VCVDTDVQGLFHVGKRKCGRKGDVEGKEAKKIKAMVIPSSGEKEGTTPAQPSLLDKRGGGEDYRTEDSGREGGKNR